MSPTAPQVFISYRRDDTAGYARAIHDALAERLGHAQVFMDVDDIGAGQAFGDVIQQAVSGSRVLLVLMGARWEGQRKDQPSRIEDPADLVRREVEAGLAKGMHVIPLLVDGTPMPAPARLPPSLRSLPGLNAMTIGNAGFATDIERLLAVVQARLAPAPPHAGVPEGQRRLARRGALALGLAAALGAGLWWQSRRPQPAGESAAARPAVNGRWQAVVRYGWQNADDVEHFEFSGSGPDLQGTASFLGVPRGLLEGAVDTAGLRFLTRTSELDGTVQLHRYRAELIGDELHFSLQSEGGGSSGTPLRFRARREAAATPPAR